MYDLDMRKNKARTMVAILEDYLGGLENLNCLNVGGSAGIIDLYLAEYFKYVIGVDIDEKAISYANENFLKENLEFQIGDAMELKFASESIDIVISSHVYEHVPDSRQMMKEIYRVLKPNGICFFAAGNRLMLNEPHYNLPFLSIFPKALAHIYLRALGKGNHYYETHLSYWGLKHLTRDFDVFDYTEKVIQQPAKYFTEYMLRPDSFKSRIALFMAKYFIWIVPSYLWVLKKVE